MATTIRTAPRLLTVLGLFLLDLGPAHAESIYGKGTAVAFSFTQPVPIRRCLANGSAISLEQEAIAPGGSAFYIINESDENAVIQFLYWKEGTENYNNFNVGYKGKNKVPKIWCVEKRHAVSNAQDYHLFTSIVPDLNVGILVVPIKLRFGGDILSESFTTDVSLGTALDLSWRISHTADVALHFPLFAGLSAVRIVPNESAVMDERSEPALSLGFGLGVSGSSVGAGLLLGCDIINDNDDVKWKRQSEIWLGISIGTTFGVAASKTEAGEKQ